MYEATELEVQRLLEITLERSASDLHLSVGKPPTLRVDGKLVELSEYEPLSPDRAKQLIGVLLNEERQKRLTEHQDVDFSYQFKENARFRVNVYWQKETLAVSLRLIPSRIRTVEELNLPPVVKEFGKFAQGLLLLVGPTGHGKSTTAAALIDLINHSRPEHIVTIEDPIEYLFVQDHALIDQREVGTDTPSFARALRAVLRQDPNVVYVGEMRDLASIATTMTIAETGHLVLATLHTNDAPQTVDRIVDVFPENQQNQIRSQLANVLVGIVSQRLLPRVGGGRLPAVEIMLATAAVRNVIREGRTYELPNIIHTSADAGMIPLDRSLAYLVSSGVVELEEALRYASDTEALRSLLRRQPMRSGG